MNKDMQKNENVLDEGNDEYIKLNARCKLFSKGKDNFALDVEAAKIYVDEHIKPKLMIFKSLKERLDFLVENQYYDKSVIDKYNLEQLEFQQDPLFL